MIFYYYDRIIITDSNFQLFLFPTKTIDPLTKRVKSAELIEDFRYEEAEKSAEKNTDNSKNSKYANFEAVKGYKLHKEIEIYDQKNTRTYSKTDLEDKVDLKMTMPLENVENSNNSENFEIEEGNKSGIDNSKEVQKHQHTSACYSSKWANKDSSPCPIFVKNRLSQTPSKDSSIDISNEPMAKEESLTQTDQETKILSSQNGNNDAQNLQTDEVPKEISTKEGTE